MVLAVSVLIGVPLNRSTQFDQKAGKAFALMYKEIKNRVLRLNKEIPDHFSRQEDALFYDIPDAHTVSIVASHEGSPLSLMKTGIHTIGDETVQVNGGQLERYVKAVQGAIALL